MACLSSLDVCRKSPVNRIEGIDVAKVALENRHRAYEPALISIRDVDLLRSALSKCSDDCCSSSLRMARLGLILRHAMALGARDAGPSRSGMPSPVAKQGEIPSDWFYPLLSEDVLRRLSTGPNGLGEADALERLFRHGPNRLPAAKQRSTLLRFLAQFDNVLIYVLLGSAAGYACCSGMVSIQR